MSETTQVLCILYAISCLSLAIHGGAFYWCTTEDEWQSHKTHGAFLLFVPILVVFWSPALLVNPPLIVIECLCCLFSKQPLARLRDHARFHFGFSKINVGGTMMSSDDIFEIGNR